VVVGSSEVSLAAIVVLGVVAVSVEVLVAVVGGIRVLVVTVESVFDSVTLTFVLLNVMFILFEDSVVKPGVVAFPCNELL